MKNKNHKVSIGKINIKALFKSLLIFILIFSITLPTFAAETNKQKEEVVYGMLNNNGSSQQVYVVNIFDSKGEIIDYGDYNNIRNMKSDDEIKVDDNKITVNNTHNKLYYEGSLKSNELPWNINIKYFMDNVEYSVEGMLGKSGDLRIEIRIEENKNIDNFFYKNYALQATVVLNTEKAEDIKADDATIVNIGKKKQLTYTILPGKGADISIQANVKDFEMEAIEINGINLNLDIDIDDKALMERAEELLSGVNKLDKGTNNIKYSVLKLKDGTNKLNSGAEKLEHGTAYLDNGVSSLENGIKEIDKALEALNNNSTDLTEGSLEFKSALNKVKNSLDDLSIETARFADLIEASSKMKNGIDELNYSLKILNENVGYDNYKAELKNKGLDIDQLEQGNDKALDTLNTMLEKLSEVSSKAENYTDIPEIEALKKEIDSQIDNFSDIGSLLKANNASINGTKIYLDQVSSSISKIYRSSAGLNESYKEFDKAILELIESLNKMVGKLPELKSAIDTLTEKYSEFDKGLNNYTDAVEGIAVGYKKIVKGASGLNSGSSLLKSASSMLYNNMSELLKGTSELYNGTEDLAEGSKKFKDKTSNLEDEIQNEIDETLLEISGDVSEAISFVSDKNKNIKSVQFVMKTNDIEFKDSSDELVAVDLKKLTLWDKVKNLFNFI